MAKERTDNEPRSAHFRRIIESLKVPLASADAKGRIAFANMALAELAERDDRSLAGAPLAELFDPADRKRLEQGVTRVADGKAASATVDARLANGTWVEVVVQPALDARDQPEGVVAIVRDATTERETDEALQVLTARLLALAEAAPVPALIESRDGDIEMVNEAFCRLLGLESAPQSLMGLNTDEVLGRSRAVDAKALERARARKKGTATLVVKLDDGNSVTLERHPIVVEGEASGSIWAPRDEKAAPAASRGVAEIALIEKIGAELSVALEGLGALSMRAQQLEFDQAFLEDFQRIRHATETAMAAIGDLVDFSNLSGSIVLRKSEFGLRAALADLVSRVLPRAEMHDCRLRLRVEQDVADRLEGDLERLDLVLKNLLESAFALLSGAEVTLQITPEYQTESGLRLSFSVLPTEESAKRELPGLSANAGMAVAVARFMIAAMGGKLAAAAHAGVGEPLYEFTLEFPVKDAPAAPAKPTFDTLIGLSVMVVSRDPAQRLALTNLLRGWRMSPLEADNGAMAMALLERCSHEGLPVPLVILTDHADFLLAFRIKNNPKLGVTLLMMLASEGRPGDAMACRENGISAYMRYPVNDRQLQEAIAAVTGAAAEAKAADAETTLVTRHSLRESRKGATVLVIDPHSESQILAAHILGRLDCNVVAAKNLGEALAALDQDVYDVVLVDVSLEGLQPEHAAGMLRSRISREPEATRLFALGTKGKAPPGFDGVVAKPFRKEDLLPIVEAVDQVPLEAD
ncbi:MAG: PAS domain-containing protein [Bacillota bacterium]